MSQIKPGILAYINRGLNAGTVVTVIGLYGHVDLPNHGINGVYWRVEASEPMMIPSIKDRSQIHMMKVGLVKESWLTPINDPDVFDYDEVTEDERESQL